MKLALLFLVCFVGVTYQQHDYWSRVLLQNRAFLYDPYYFNYGNEPQQPTGSEAKEDARFRFFNLKPQTKKFFSGNTLIPSSFFASLTSVPVTTVSSTVFVTSTSTATIASVQSCIPSTMFITQLAAQGAVTLTTPCARRKRSNDDRELIAPSNVAFLEPSAAPEFKIDNLPAMRNSDFELLSSQREPTDEVLRNNFYIQQRTLTITSTVTSTLTTYSFATTIFKKPFSLSNQNALSCLPAGFAVC